MLPPTAPPTVASHLNPIRPYKRQIRLMTNSHKSYNGSLVRAGPQLVEMCNRSECTVGTRVGATVGRGGGACCCQQRECTVGTRVGATVGRGGGGCPETRGAPRLRRRVRDSAAPRPPCGPRAAAPGHVTPPAWSRYPSCIVTLQVVEKALVVRENKVSPARGAPDLAHP